MSDIKVKWEKIVVGDKPIIKIINLGNGTQFKLISFHHCAKLFVALERLGAFFFDCKRFKAGIYVSEKLNICIADANIIADWINSQLNMNDIQQGHYSLNYINPGDEDYFYYPTPAIIKPTIIELSSNIIPSNQTEQYNLSKTFYEDH